MGTTHSHGNVHAVLKYPTVRRRRRANELSCVGDYLGEMSAFIVRLTVARQARPSGSTLCGDQSDQTLWRSQRILLLLPADDQLPGDRCARYLLVRGL